jgi:glycine betaine catabolism B
MATEANPMLSCGLIPWWDREADAQLLCVDVRDETHDVKTFSFRAPQPRLFSFTAGQYMVFELEIDGEKVSRCYSLSSSPLRPSSVSITVKRVAGGRVSNWLHEHLRPGQLVAVRGPAGQFTLPTTGPGSELAGPYLFASGGSGITPLMSMARALADARHHPDIVFLHASRTPADVIFQDELRQMAKVTPGFRLLLLPESLAGSPDFPGMTGRVSEEFLKLAVPDIAQRTVMCCGPAPFMSAVRRCATALGVPPERYAEESFDASTLDDSPANPAPATQAVRTYQVTFAKQSRVMPVEATQTVLAAARKAGISLPSSCASGLCGTCKTKLVSGQVDMKQSGGLRRREIDAGYVLPCCSKPLSDLVLER